MLSSVSTWATVMENFLANRHGNISEVKIHYICSLFSKISGKKYSDEANVVNVSIWGIWKNENICSILQLFYKSE